MKYLILLLLSFNAFAAPALLSGEPPALREDGAVFDVATELEGFNVYCGTETGNYTDLTAFNGYTLPLTSWTVDLPNGVSYCVVTAIDKEGRESAYSDEITVTMDGKYLPDKVNVIDTIYHFTFTFPQTTGLTPSLTIN